MQNLLKLIEDYTEDDIVREEKIFSIYNFDNILGSEKFLITKSDPNGKAYIEKNLLLDWLNVIFKWPYFTFITSWIYIFKKCNIDFIFEKDNSRENIFNLEIGNYSRIIFENCSFKYEWKMYKSIQSIIDSNTSHNIKFSINWYFKISVVDWYEIINWG